MEFLQDGPDRGAKHGEDRSTRTSKLGMTGHNREALRRRVTDCHAIATQACFLQIGIVPVPAAVPPPDLVVVIHDHPMILDVTPPFGQAPETPEPQPVAGMAEGGRS